MPEPQTEQQRAQANPYHPDSAEGRALHRYQEGSSEHGWIVLDKGDRETTELEIEQAVQGLKALGVKTKD